jgi:hypothetical protein
MADPVMYGLTEADVKLLKEMANAYRTDYLHTRNRGAEKEEQGFTPEVYVARTPVAGIPGLDLGVWTTGSGTGTVASDDTPGSAQCFVYRLLPNGGVLHPLHVKRLVYNLSTDSVIGGIWVPVIRDKFGSWFVAGAGAAGGGGGSSIAVDVVHVAEVSGTGTGGGWFCQRVVQGIGGTWVVADGPVEYHSVTEIQNREPILEDSVSTVGATVSAVTLLYRDINGNYFIDFGRQEDYDFITFPSQIGCVGGVPQFTGTTTVRIVVDNFTDFPNIEVRTENV